MSHKFFVGLSIYLNMLKFFVGLSIYLNMLKSLHNRRYHCTYQFYLESYALHGSQGAENSTY